MSPVIQALINRLQWAVFVSWRREATVLHLVDKHSNQLDMSSD